MKKSIGYGYDNFLLADTSDFGYGHGAGEDVLSDTGDIVFGYDSGLYRERLEDLLREVAQTFEARYVARGARRFEGAYVAIFAESKRFEIGLDSSGARPAIFVRPKNFKIRGRVTPCKITAQVVKGFRRLLASRPHLWSYPSSAATAFRVGWISDRGLPVSRGTALRGGL